MKIAVAAVFACCMSHAFAQQSTAALSSIRVMGTAVITAKPDRAQVDVGVVTQAAQSQAAASQNARQLDAVLVTVRKVLGAGADIRTISYSLNPSYQYHPNGEQPTLSGYVATNVVRITVDDLSKVPVVIDASTHSGANQIQSVQFLLRDQESVRAQALREAAVRARGEADTLAAALGLKVSRILTVEEEGPAAAPRPQVMMAAKTASHVSTPIQAGDIDVSATVSLVVEVTSKP